jgi:hypothetical protein
VRRERGRARYDRAGTLLDHGRPDEGIVLLDGAEEDRGQVRRALAYGLAGAGASALVEAQSAVLQHRGGRRRELARALAVNADVSAAYGDPDLAVASADLAIRLFLRGRRLGADREDLRRALAVAVAVHAAHGRDDLAGQAGTVARRIGGLVGPAPTVLETRRTSLDVTGPVGTAPTVLETRRTSLDVTGPVGTAPTVLESRRPGLELTVAAALTRLGRPPPTVAGRSVLRPAVALELLVPLNRVLGPVDPAAERGRAGDEAARLGRTLAALAIELLPADGAAGGRLGLEAHALLAGASRLGSELLRRQLPTFGPPWAAALLACSRGAEADRDHALALDLAAWAARVATQLFPATLVDRETGVVAAEALDHHRELATAPRSPPR